MASRMPRSTSEPWKQKRFAADAITSSCLNFPRPALKLKPSTARFEMRFAAAWTGRPCALLAGGRRRRRQGLGNARVDCRAMESKVVRGRLVRGQLLVLSETRLEVEAVDRAVRVQVRGIVDALPLIDVRQRDVLRDRDGREPA